MKFWLWFKKNETLIRKIIQRGTLEQQAELREYFDKYILDLGKFSWEINQVDTRLQFIISPNRDPELLAKSKEIIALAPILPNWEFLPAKPSNLNLEVFEVYDDNFQKIQIEPRKWRSSSLTNTTISIYAKELVKTDTDTRLYACRLVFSACLGEEKFIALNPYFDFQNESFPHFKPILEWL